MHPQKGRRGDFIKEGKVRCGHGASLFILHLLFSIHPQPSSLFFSIALLAWSLGMTTDVLFSNIFFPSCKQTDGKCSVVEQVVEVHSTGAGWE